ncbi:hypothetical protein [Kordia sp.]|uniref:hypothetical protein n=1 Tax=Kordia sp. TaxID=1965332 RepID=UPI003B5BB617
MIQKFLKAKHWQLFLLMVALPFLIQMIFMMSMFTSMFANIDNQDPEHIINTFQSVYSIFPVIMILNAVFLFGWLWSMGVGLQKYVPLDVKLNVSRFKWFLIIPLVYITLFSFLFGLLFSNAFNNPEAIASFALPSMAIILPLHLFSMFCMFYLLYFVSKTLKTIELQREAKFGDYVKEALLLWFYPIGIWILQPQINKIVAEDRSPKTN